MADVAVSSLVVKDVGALTVGASLTADTVTLIVSLVSTVPSLAVMVKLSVPFVLASGV